MAPIDPIRARLAEYAAATPEEEHGALKEILQEVALFGLSNAGFFEHAAFHGGTSLRIAHALPRFSEDLDFALHRPDSAFTWSTWFDVMSETFRQFGIEPELTDRHRAGKAVQSMWLKDDSIGAMLDLSFAHTPGQKLRIKLEIDTNPPAGASNDRRFLNFPVEHPVQIWDLPSNFAGKLHACLCRPYVKGRDWFDFNWYIRRKSQPNLALLAAALQQQGPWAGQGVQTTAPWLHQALVHKIEAIDWERAKVDVAPFVKGPELAALNHWDAELFAQSASRLLAV